MPEQPRSDAKATMNRQTHNSDMQLQERATMIVFVSPKLRIALLLRLPFHRSHQLSSRVRMCLIHTELPMCLDNLPPNGWKPLPCGIAFLFCSFLFFSSTKVLFSYFLLQMQVAVWLPFIVRRKDFLGFGTRGNRILRG